MKNKRENGLRDDLEAAQMFGTACLLRVHWTLSEERKKEKVCSMQFFPNSSITTKNVNVVLRRQVEVSE